MVKFLKKHSWYAPAVRTLRTFVQALLGITIAKWMARLSGDPKISDLWVTVSKDWDPILGMSLSTCIPAWLINAWKPSTVETKK